MSNDQQPRRRATYNAIDHPVHYDSFKAIDASAPFKVWEIQHGDEWHKLTPDQINELLKVIDERPEPDGMAQDDWMMALERWAINVSLYRQPTRESDVKR